MSDYRCISADVKLGKDVKLSQFVNLYGCEIGDYTQEWAKGARFPVIPLSAKA
jgi:hypothetical protein